MKRITVLAMSLAFVITLINAGHAQDHQKSSWYIGFGLGTGNGAFEADGESITFNEFFEGSDTSPRITLNFGVGMILSPEVHLGLDFTAIRQEGTVQVFGSDLTVGIQINNYLLMMTWFPYSEGFFVRGGAGMAVLVQNIVYGNTEEKYGMRGYSALGGIGYAFWLGETFNLCLNAEVSYQKYNDAEVGEPESSYFWNVYVSFYWF
jgi:opacity protein-like surface antigen